MLNIRKEEKAIFIASFIVDCSRSENCNNVFRIALYWVKRGNVVKLVSN